jgi:hypothetical protein
MKDEIQEALRIAVKELYFDDSADFGSGLWEIVKILGGDDAVNLLENDPESAYLKYVRQITEDDDEKGS